ncbi:MAG: hypothetical protein Ct9H300mP20_13920 [Gammaproteobacteria bacterium]|nr:MAG: hypothetical protein Ct9H300mP20_13920 [Gammaproteobacteria bacterium]
MPEEISQNELLALRRAKLDDLRSKGNAFPNDFRRDALKQGSYMLLMILLRKINYKVKK